MAQILVPTTAAVDWKRLLAKPDLHWKAAMERHGCSRSGRIGAAASIVLLVAACHRTPVGVDVSALQVRADVTPTEIAASADPDGGRVQVVVSVTNPRAQPVVVQLGGPPYKSGQIPPPRPPGSGSASACWERTA